MRKAPTRRDTLLERKAFQAAVFARDGGKCLFCDARGDETVLDAHHIIERRLWSAPHEAGGYFERNGATMCKAKCHMLAEQTILSVEDIRAAAGITGEPLVPEHLYADAEVRYTKWGDVILPDGTRTMGELFDDESVRKVLREGGVLDLYRREVRYPRTFHTPGSNASTDDKTLASLDHFAGRRVIVSRKMDGECSSLYRHTLHARSPDGRDHVTRSWLKNFWSRFAHEIPETFRICCENLWAVHGLRYDDLQSYALVFSIWDGLTCLSYDETIEWMALISSELVHVPVVYDGPFDQKIWDRLCGEVDPSRDEGLVIRVADSFKLKDFRSSVAKYVHPGFNRSSTHNWSNRVHFEQNGVVA